VTAWALFPLAMLAFIFIHRTRYEVKMLKLRIALVAEAQMVAAECPGEYPAYRAEAVGALGSHGVGDLAALLPPA
jgi:hypothetical protein